VRPLLPLLALFLANPAVAEAPHWSFVPPRRPDVPAVQAKDWPRNPIDAFILARLEHAGLRPAPEADRVTLIRRVTFDLIGLPPTPKEIDDFVADRSLDAYEKVVDRLLASPHFGERWATHWLDVVRYAESNGYELDGERPHAWRYRDWVVRALNDDLPFDRFLTHQVAGDLLARDAVKQGLRGADDPAARPLLAAGMNRCGPIHLVSGNLDAAVLRNEALTEMTSAVGSVFLGLTVGCARCHNHKFDPLPQRDYYRLEAFFATTQPKEVDLATAEERAVQAKALAAWEAEAGPLRKQIDAIDAPYKERISAEKKAKLEPHFRTALDTPALKRTPEQIKLAMQAGTLIKVTWDEVIDALTPEDRARRAQLRERLHALDARKPALPAQAWTVEDAGGEAFSHVLRLGDPHRKGEKVSPGFPQALARGPDDGQAPPRDRLDLARWLARPDHPLTARVIINRLWQHHFGRGLVATPNDFGTRGAPPTHPDLLDWLACELPARAWSLKHLHRLMVLSSTYRQDSRVRDERTRRIDAENRLLGRMPRQRLSGEALRDAMLAVSGALNRDLGGPMVRVPLEPEVYDLIFTEGEPDGLWPVTSDARQHHRRSLYLFAKRNVRLPLLEAFDQPDTLTSCPVRPVSTFAPQALILLNGPFARGQAKVFAARLLRAAGPDRAAQVARAYRLALGRPPRPDEARLAEDFLSEQTSLLADRLLARLPVGVPEGLPGHADLAEAAALADFCLALLNCNEFIYLR
jgi:hypothetical protein